MEKRITLLDTLGWVAVKRSKNTYPQRVFEIFRREWRIDDEIPVVTDDRTSFRFPHPERWFLGSQKVQVLQNLRVGEGGHLHGDTSLPLHATGGQLLVT